MIIKREKLILLAVAMIIYTRVKSNSFIHGYQTKQCELFSEYFGVKYSALMRFVGYMKQMYLINRIPANITQLEWEFLNSLNALNNDEIINLINSVIYVKAKSDVNLFFVFGEHKWIN